MANEKDASTDPLEKPPAKVVARKRTPTRSVSAAKKSPAKKAPAKKAATKKSPVKQAPAKKTVAKKAPVKKAVAKKAPVKKAVATKAPATKAPAKKAPVTKAVPKKAVAKAPVKKAVAKKVVAKKAPAKKAPVKKSVVRKDAAEHAYVKPTATPVAPGSETPSSSAGATKRPAQKAATTATRRSVSSTPQPTPDSVQSAALAVSVTESLLNDIALIAVGAGIALDPIRTEVPLPGVGDVAVDVQLKVTTAHTELLSDADGTIKIHATAEADLRPADNLAESPVILPLPPAPIPLVVAVKVQPLIELDGGVVRFSLPASGLTLDRIEVDTTVGAPEGVESNMWISMLAIFNMMLSQMGSDLFENLLSSGPKPEFELTGTAPDLLDRLGVQQGRATVSVAEKLLTVTFPGRDDINGTAWPVPIAGKRAGVALSATSVNEVAQYLLEQAVSGMPVPFDIDVSLGEQQVASRIRQSRLLPRQFPDLRSALRSEVRTRLVRGQIELSVEAIWFETPDILPGVINSVSRRLGGLAGLAPLKIRVPERIEIPLPGDESISIGIAVDDLRVSQDGIGAAVMLA